MKIIVPYIYKLTFIADGRVYIGSRFNKGGCHPDEFWIKYFTSSKYVKALIAEHGTDKDVWNVEILEVFDDYESLRDVPRKENEYILQHLEVLGRSGIINRRWVVDGKEVYSNAGMNYKSQAISDKSKGFTTVKDSDGNILKVTVEEFEARDDLVGVGAGMKFYHNPETQHRIKLEADETPPEGYVRGLGKIHSDEQKESVSNRRKGTTIINDGTVNKTIKVGEEIPEGWVLGTHSKRDMPGWTEGRRARRAETIRKRTEEKERLKALEPKVEKVRKPYRKRTPEEIEFNIQRQKEAHAERIASGIPHKNSGRKRSQDSIDKQTATRKANKEQD